MEARGGEEEEEEEEEAGDEVGRDVMARVGIVNVWARMERMRVGLGSDWANDARGGQIGFGPGRGKAEAASCSWRR